MRRRIETFTFTFRQISLICFWKVRESSIVSPSSWIWLIAELPRALRARAAEHHG